MTLFQDPKGRGTNEDSSRNPVADEPTTRIGPTLVTRSAEAKVDDAPLPVWLQRSMLIVKVILAIEMGLLLVVLPWTTVWSQNSLMLRYPEVRAVLQQNFVRGVVTGIGLIDIWIGIWEAAHYHDQKPQ